MDGRRRLKNLWKIICSHADGNDGHRPMAKCQAIQGMNNDYPEEKVDFEMCLSRGGTISASQHYEERQPFQAYHLPRPRIINTAPIAFYREVSETEWLSPQEIRALPREENDDIQLTAETQLSFANRPYWSSRGFHFYKGSIFTTTGSLSVSIKRQIRDFKGQWEIEQLDREIKLWWDLEHPNILPLYGWKYYNLSMIDIIMPHIPNRDVATYLGRKQEEKQSVQRFKLIVGLANALVHLHHAEKPAIVHGGLEPRCVLVGEGDVALLSDFSVAERVDPITRLVNFTREGYGLCATHQANYVAPERVCDFDNLGPHSDVWGWSMVALFIMSGEHPWYNVGGSYYVGFARNGEFPEEKHHLPERWDAYPGLWSIIESCWRMDTSERPTMGTIAAQLGQYLEPWII